MHREYLSQAIPLFKRNAEKNNSFVVLYTENFGKVNVLIQAAKNIQSKLNSHLETAGIVEALYIQGKFRKKILSVKQLKSFSNLWNDYYKIIYWLYFVETFNHLVKYEYPDKKIYNFLKYVLENLDKLHYKEEEDLKFFINLMIYRLLRLLSYHNYSAYCVNCSKKIDNKAYLNTYLGEIICEDCFAKKEKIYKYYLLDKVSLDLLFLLSNENTLSYSLNFKNKIEFNKLIRTILNIYVDYPSKVLKI